MNRTRPHSSENEEPKAKGKKKHATGKTYRCQISSGPEGGSHALHPPEREIPVPPLAAGRHGPAGTANSKTGAAAVRVRPRGRTAGQCEGESPQK
jgi:hypothetical protein